jgi:hypothetical protein
MLFEVVAYSVSEDWVQAVSTFDHQYPEITATTWWKPLEQGAFRQTVFKGCCRLSELSGGNADTSWALVSVVNLLQDYSSPRLASLPIITLRKRQRPADPDPSFYILADDNYPTANQPAIQPAMPAAWGFTTDIGGPGASADEQARPRNLPNFVYDAVTGRITLAAGPALNASGVRCANWTAPDCRASPGLPGLPPGLYNVVLEVSRAAAGAAEAPGPYNSSAPIEVMVSLVDEGVAGALPSVGSPDPEVFYPAFSHARHVAYVGFPMQPVTVTANTTAHGVTLGFTVGRLPPNFRLSTVRGGVTAFTGARCTNGSAFCLQNPSARCNASTAGCTCQPPNNGAPCNASAPPGGQCALGGACLECWDRRDCAPSAAAMTLSWTPVSGQEWTHMVCLAPVAQRPAPYCPAAPAPGPPPPGCAPASGPPECLNVDVLPNPPPALWSSYAAEVDPYAGSGLIYLGRPLEFTLYSNDSDCAEARAPPRPAPPAPTPRPSPTAWCVHGLRGAWGRGEEVGEG